MATHVPTSEILDELARSAGGRLVTMAWIVARLRERSFGIVMLLIALVGLLPGMSTPAGLLVAVPAIQMMLGHAAPVLPRRIAGRSFAGTRLARLLDRTVPVLRWLERFVRPRWPTPFAATRRVIGTVVLLLGLTLLAPIPFSQVIPISVIMLIAFAFLEEDGVLLAAGLAAAIVSLAITAAAIWGSVEAGRAL